VLLSNVDGLLDDAGHRVPLMQGIENGRKLVREEKSALGKGGMNSKLEAGRMITDSGEILVIASGRQPEVLKRILAGDDVGTMFVPASADGRKRTSRSRWIGSVRPSGSIIVDDGAVSALTQKNRSLLAAGIVKVEGSFARGDVIAISGSDGRTIARGLSNYASDDVRRICGKKTQQVRELLGEAAYDEVVHRDNLVIG